MKVCFETFGCRLNKAEALQQEADFLARGWELADGHSDANLFIVRGCSVTARAQRDCERFIDHLKRRYPNTPIRIEGCMGKKVVHSTMPAHPDRPAAAAASDAVPTRTARAYLKAQDGCAGKCTFCIVPQFRGSSVSIPFQELQNRTRRFIDAGYREIVVTGCNLALYASEGKRLPDLVASLAGIASDAHARLRIGSLEPGDCSLETVHAISESSAVCQFVHVAAQSGSNRILKAMNRGYDVEDVNRLVEAAAAAMPFAGIGCALMTGFPGESELEFRATQGLLKRLPFSNAHVFPYSERPGTIAAGLPGAIAKAVRSSRAHRLAGMAAEKRLKFAKRFIGRTVCIAAESDDKCVGWTGEYLRCSSVSPVRRKSLAKIFVTNIHRDASLEGRLMPS